MVLYHAISTYQILSSIVHRKKYHNEEKAILLLPHFITNKHANYYRLVECQLFDEVILFPYTFPYELNTIEDSVAQMYKKNVPYDIGDFSNIYIGACHFPITIYLIKNNISFSYFEDAAGILSRPEVLRNTMVDGAPNHTKIADYYDLYCPNSELVQSKICKLSAQKEEFFDPKAVDFDITKELSYLDKRDLDIIKDFFGCPKNIDVGEKTALILTQHFANLGMMSYEEQVLIYQLFVDYFLEGYSLIIKTHPSDALHYNYLFPSSYVLREKFPSEFLTTIFSKMPSVIATISSTAIQNLKDDFEHVLCMGTSFEKKYLLIHSYYTAIKFFSLLKPSFTMHFASEEKIFVQNLIKFSDVASEEIPIIDDISLSDFIVFDMYNISDLEYSSHIIKILDEIADSQVVCFINCNLDYGFYDLNRKDLWMNIVPVRITKTVKEGEDFYSDENEEVIYFFTKNLEVQKKLEGLHYEKSLKASGVEVSMDSNSGKDREILILKGILDATEKRLLHYIKREDELKKQIKNIMKEED